MTSQTIIQLLPLIILLGFNVFLGTIAMKMAKKRGLRPVPAFWATIFGTCIALFYIAMHPITENKS